MDLPALQAAGLYDPASPTAGDRLALLEHLERRGASIEDMVAADAAGLLYGLISYLTAFPSVPQLTIDEVSRRSGMSEHGIRRLQLAQGLPVDETTRLPDFVVDDVEAFALGTSMFGEESTLAFTRVMGASVARIVDAAIGIFYGEVDPTLSTDATELERAEINERAGAVFAVVPSVVVHLLQQCFGLQSMRAASVHGAGVGQTATVGVGFVDLVGSTAWAESLSLKDHALALARFETAAWDIAVAGGGRVVKLIGDAAMIVAPSPEAVCRVAVDLCAAAAADASLPAARGAVGYGDVTARGGDYVGPLVNLVARAVKVAGAGAVVVTDDVRTRLPARWPVTDIGSHVLRGIDDETRLFRLDADGAGADLDGGVTEGR